MTTNALTLGITAIEIASAVSKIRDVIEEKKPKTWTEITNVIAQLAFTILSLVKLAVSHTQNNTSVLSLARWRIATDIGFCITDITRHISDPTADKATKLITIFNRSIQAASAALQKPVDANFTNIIATVEIAISCRIAIYNAYIKVQNLLRRNRLWHLWSTTSNQELAISEDDRLANEHAAETQRQIQQLISSPELPNDIPPIIALDERIQRYRCMITGKPIRFIAIAAHSSLQNIYFERAAIDRWIAQKPNSAPPGWPEDLLPLQTEFIIDAPTLQKEIDKNIMEIKENYRDLYERGLL